MHHKVELLFLPTATRLGNESHNVDHVYAVRFTSEIRMHREIDLEVAQHEVQGSAETFDWSACG